MQDTAKSRILCLPGFQVNRLLIRLGCLTLLCLLLGFIAEAKTLIQKRPATVVTSKNTTPPEPKRPEQVENVSDDRPVREILKFIKKSSIVITTSPQVAGAKIVVQRSSGLHAYTKQSNEQGFVVFESMPAGQYQVTIQHADYETTTATLILKKDKIETLPGVLIPKHGVVVLQLPAELTPAEIEASKLELDGLSLLPTMMTRTAMRLTLLKVTVGVHRCLLRVPGYDDWLLERLEVKPGRDFTNVIDVTLEQTLIALTIKSLPGVHLFLKFHDNEYHETIAESGNSKVYRLLPATYEIAISKPGYITYKQTVTLTLAELEKVLTVTLIPAVETNEANDQLYPGNSPWSESASQWRIINGPRCLIGEGVGLIKTNNKGLPFNVYGDFVLRMTISLGNGQGASWVARAVDEQNYYLFELTRSTLQDKRKYLKFSLCRQGKCEEQDPAEVFAEIDRPGEQLEIELHARGNRLHHTIKLASDPNKPMQLGKDVIDDTFAFGGVGFRAQPGHAVCFYEFQVRPVVSAK